VALDQQRYAQGSRAGKGSGSAVIPGYRSLRVPAKCAVVLIAFLLAACASREILVPKSSVLPAGVDFSGTWRIRKEAGGDQRSINQAIRKTNGVRDRVIIPPVQGDRSRVPRKRHNTGGLVHVFLVSGTTLKITQTGGALFLSFDRAVVEEYRFGENREVRVGPVIADRVSGWEGKEYVSETLDQDGMKLTERFALLNHHTLQRTITLRSKGNEEVTIVQTFDRIG